MTSGIATPLHFAVHLLAVFAALAVVLSLLREGGRQPARLAGIAGFLALGVGEAVHAGAFAGDLDAVPVLLRTVGYVLIAGAALLPMPSATPAFLGISGAALPPALAALAAAGLTLRRPSSGRYLLGGGLALLAISEALLGGGGDGLSHVLRGLGWLAVGAAALGEARRSIQFRFVTGFVAVLLLVVLVLSVAVTQVIDRNVSAGALTRLRGQARATIDQMQPLARQQAVGLVLLLENLIDFREQGNPIRQAEVAQIRDTVLADVDFMLFLNADGLEEGRLDLGAGEVADVAGSDVVQYCLNNVADAASLDTLGATRMGLIGCDALRFRTELALVGIAGHRVDGQLIRRVAPPGVLAAMFRGVDPVPAAVAGSFAGVRTNQPMVSPQTIQSVMERFLAGSSGLEREMRIGTRDYFVAFAPLKRSDQTVIGVLMVAEPAAVVDQTREAVSRVIFLVTLGVVLLALFLALLTARRITRPVLALTQAARRVQAGDLAAKADVTAQDEVGDLARAFNRMTDSVTDATERLRSAAEAEARLRDRLETVLNSMGDGLLAVDDDGLVSTYNPAAGQILGLPERQVLGRPVEEILTGRGPDGQPIGLGDDGAAPGVSFIKRPDGREVPVSISSSLLRDASGSLLGRVFVLRDMSREHEVERMKTEFLSNVSHELRTPLTPIIGYSEIMTRRGVPTERGQEFAGAILDSARRLERIVAMLVDFSAMEGGRMTIESRPTSLRKLVKSAVDDWKDRAAQHRFVTRFDQGLPEAEVDVSLVRRAVDELIDNAVKYSPNGGNIRVSVSSPNSRSKRILRVDVQDEGIGIEEGDLATIFDDFHQVDASDTRTYGGLGLGLAFVRRIVEAHRGEISAQSRPGQGSTFTFTLPVINPEGSE